jgi:hypothetical protein
MSATEPAELHPVAEAAVIATTKRTLELFAANIGQVRFRWSKQARFYTFCFCSLAPTSFRVRKVGLPRRLPLNTRQ